MRVSRSEEDRRKSPVYTLAEAAHYLRIAPATVRAWMLGSSYATQAGSVFAQPLIARADASGRRLSFENLVELHVLRALRHEPVRREPAQAARQLLAQAGLAIHFRRASRMKTARRVS